MKSAYELAMERFGAAPVKKLSDEQKAKLAEIDSLYTSRIAQAELAAKDRLAKAGQDRAARQQVSDDLIVELASLRERCEREKDKIRNAAP